MEAVGEVRWPSGAVDTQGDDLGKPIKNLLVALSMLGSEADTEKASSAAAALTGPGASVAIIESGATAMAKGWSGLLAAVGGGGALWASVNDFWLGQPTAERVALTAALGAVVAMSILSVCLIVRTDLHARGEGAVAQYRARAEVANVFLLLAQRNVRPEPAVQGSSQNLDQLLLALAADKANLELHLRNGDWKKAAGVRHNGGDQLEVDIAGVWIGADEVAGFRTVP
jgi:hypothetical protein